MNNIHSISVGYDEHIEFINTDPQNINDLYMRRIEFPITCTVSIRYKDHTYETYSCHTEKYLNNIDWQSIQPSEELDKKYFIVDGYKFRICSIEYHDEVLYDEACKLLSQSIL